MISGCTIFKRVITNVLYPMGIIISDRMRRNVLVVNQLHTGQVGKISWAGDTYWADGGGYLGWVYICVIPGR